MKVGSFGWRLKGLFPCFLISPYFWFPRLSPLPFFNGLAAFRQRGTKNTGYAWLIPCYSLVNDIVVAYLTYARLDIATRRERMCELGGFRIYY